MTHYIMFFNENKSIKERIQIFLYKIYSPHSYARIQGQPFEARSIDHAIEMALDEFGSLVVAVKKYHGDDVYD